MAESLVQVTEGVGKKLHTWSRTIGANTVEDEFVIPGEYPLASYVANAQSISVATASSHLMQIMAGASLNVRIRRITVDQVANATAAGLMRVAIVRLTTAGTGGTVVTPRPYDSADAASGATAMTLPTVKGTVASTWYSKVITLRQALATTGTVVDDTYEWTAPPGSKGILIPAGAANGIALEAGGNAGATVDLDIEFVETSFAG